MSADYETMVELYGKLGQDPAVFRASDVAHIVVHENKVLGTHLVPGLEARAREMEDGVELSIALAPHTVVARPVHMCFGVLPESGTQRIALHVRLAEGSRMSVLAHCVFPNAVDVRHIMDARIELERGAAYTYLERHVHGQAGGVRVVPRARVRLGPEAAFETEFELIDGRAGAMEIDYEAFCAAGSSLRMTARIAARADDRLKLREVGHLDGERSSGALLTRVALRDEAQADVYNELTATAAYARGHVDCKEIVQGNALASATPVVRVAHPLARVTHEASIGSVDSKQLQTLMARGLSEEEGVEMIVRGLLRAR